VAEQVLPHSSLYLGLRFVLILNNASIYKSERLRELCEQYSVLLRFLLPYSPDFNPIEATFKDIKAWIKRNYRLVKDFKSFKAFFAFRC
jgi:transposase